MLETYTTVLTDVSRNLYRNMRDSPILYLWFGLMMFFSVVMLAGLTFFMIEAEIEISLDDVFFTVFFVFLLKVSYDFHRHFIKSDAVSYSLSTPVKHSKTVFEIFLVIFWSNLGLWVLLSSLYSVTLIYLGINMGYPVEYLKFTFGVMLACVIGVTVSLHFFSSKRYRLSPAVAMGASLYYFRDFSSLLVANDGGPGHFSVLTGIPSIILYGPEAPHLYEPLSPNSISLYAPLSCSPCLTAYNHKNSPCNGDNICLKSIAPNSVLKKSYEILEKHT